jgi:hypothetical protein
MDNTTLHTFLLYVYPSLPPNVRLSLTSSSSHCPNALRSLVLLGSWDNFARPYSLELDARRGRNYWQGCFTFSDIICDGDLDNQVPKRDGPLKMGGTYWYYVSQLNLQHSHDTDVLQYKVDGDDECHNPSEPSTTFCPLLPGQRLNILELPTEGHCRSRSDPSDGFTRNPSDRYLNPVPPAPLRPTPSPHQRSATSTSYRLPSPSPWAPRSATYPQPEAFLSPNVVRHARSASASPHMPSTPLFVEFKCLKDKLASKRSGARSRSSSKSRELQIGSPILISTTAEDLNLIPLPSYRPAPTSAPRDALPNAVTATRSIPCIRKEFSPLGSHPVNPVYDAIFVSPISATERRPSLGCRRSHVPSTIITSELRLGQSRIRANSADTHRTQHCLFSNDPWLSTPKLQQSFELDAPNRSENIQPVPTLQRPSNSLAPPSASERPTSSHGSSRTSSLRQAPLDKELPALPRYLTPAPLFACNDLAPVELHAEVQQEEEEFQEDDDDDKMLDDLIKQYQDKPASHFSTWSNESMAYSYPTSDDDVTNSPTISSLDSDYSDTGSPQRTSIRYSYRDTMSVFEHGHATLEDDVPSEQEEQTSGFLSATPPRLDDVRVSAFGSDLFSLDIQHVDSASRRQAACFGLGFHYSLPDEDTTSKTTITESSLQPEPNVQRESSLSQLSGLMNDFAYLGEAVI